jgi:hypothetical protein
MKFSAMHLSNESNSLVTEIFPKKKIKNKLKI